jgi:hypothetical protein
MARPTPSSALLRKNKKLHSITECLLNLTKITVRQKQNPRSARARPVSGHFLQMNSMCWAWYSAP